MKNLSRLSLTAVFLVWGAAYADEPDSNEASQKHGRVIYIEEEDWGHLSDEPGRHLESARESFVAVDARRAAAELRKAAAYMRISAKDAADRTKKSLTASGKELDALALRVEQGAVKSVNDFDAATARAYHSLAQYQNAKARQAWADKQMHRAGQFWQSATTSLERATARTEASFRVTTQEVVRESRALSNRMVKGEEFVADEIGHGLEAFGKQVELVGKRMEKDHH